LIIYLFLKFEKCRKIQQQQSQLKSPQYEKVEQLDSQLDSTAEIKTEANKIQQAE
jgi:hypothetical protein